MFDTPPSLQQSIEKEVSRGALLIKAMIWGFSQGPAGQQKNLCLVICWWHLAESCTPWKIDMERKKKQRYGRWCSFSIEKFLSSMLNFRGVFFFSLLPCFKYIPCCQALLHATASATKETESANSCLTQKLIRKLMGLKYLENSLSNDLDTPVMMVKITWSSCAMIQWWFISYEAIESSQQDSRIVPIRAITQID